MQSDHGERVRNNQHYYMDKYFTLNLIQVGSKTVYHCLFRDNTWDTLTHVMLVINVETAHEI